MLARRWFASFGLVLGAILVAPNAVMAGVLDASWTAPTTNTDGTPLTDMTSYRVYYGTSGSPCLGGTFVQVASSTTTPPSNQTVAYRLTNLTTGTLYYVSLTAVDGAGLESTCSTIASAVAQLDIAATPIGTTNFGTVNLGSSATQTFTIQSTRGGTITGTASVAAPFSIVSGSPFTLVGSGATATVTVRFTPTNTVAASTNVNFTADGDILSRLVTGTGASPASTLTVSTAGAGSGTVTSSPAGISCGATCSASFTSGTAVTLTASPAAGSTFSGWSGGGCTGTGTCTGTINAATSVTASFVQSSFTLSVTTSGNGAGSVASFPAGISCGATCSQAFTSGTAITLAATPAVGSKFAGWSGGGCSGTSACTLNMNAPTSVTAAFTQQTLSDTTPPTVSITAPTASATVTGTVTVTASATDNVGVASVQFQLDGMNLGAAVTTSPYGVTWNTTTAANGAHALTAVGRDAAGNQATSTGVSVTVTNATSSPVDVTPPVISRVSLSVTSIGATVSWTTNEPSDTQVEYGLTTSYGSLAPLDPALVPSHSQAIKGLAPNTWYHFRMRSRDAAGNLGLSGDFKFKTRSH